MICQSDAYADADAKIRGHTNRMNGGVTKLFNN